MEKTIKKPSPKKVTIKSIAEKLGISFSTVAKSLNDDETIKKETRDLVKNKANEMGYSPNLLARGLRTNTTKTIAIIFNDIENPVLTYIFKTISVAMAKHGYTTLISDSQFDVNSERFSIESMTARMPDFVIIAPASTKPKNIDFILKKTRNVICFDAKNNHAECHFIDVDYAYGGYIAACELLSKGHRQILIITEPIDYPYSHYYLNGIKKAFGEYAIKYNEDYVRYSHSSFEDARSIILSLWDNETHAFKLPFTAVMCFGDNFALGAYRALFQLGLSVPNDISVIGFDDNEIGEFSAPELSTVHLPKERMAHCCLEILESHLIHKKEVSSLFYLSPHLVRRSSVKSIYQKKDSL